MGAHDNNPFGIHSTDDQGNSVTDNRTTDPKYPGGRYTTIKNSGGGKLTYVKDANGRIVKVDHKPGNNSGGGGGCYIATATLQKGGSEAQLNLLRRWRDDILNATALGRKLEAFYDLTGPVVASHVPHNPLLASSFLYPFVKPAVWLAQKREMHPDFRFVANTLIFIIFLAGLVYGSLVYLFYRLKG